MVPSSSDNPNPVQSNRRWLRLSLRTFVLVLTLGCLLLGWIANRAQQQRRAVQWITDLGGNVTYDFAFDGSQIVVVDESGSTYRVYPSDRRDFWLYFLLGRDNFADVIMATLTGANLGQDRGSLGRLEPVDFAPLSGLKKLSYLSIEGTGISELTPLSGLTNLKSLNLNRTKVSDLSPLRGLSKLESLSLDDTPVSDLSPLANLKSLELVFISNTQVSRENYETLRKSLPSLLIAHK